MRLLTPSRGRSRSTMARRRLLSCCHCSVRRQSRPGQDPWHVDLAADLRADYAVECGTDSHRRVRDIAWLGIFLYPVGISLFYAVLLLAARRALVEDKPTALSKALSFLVRDYDFKFMWCELHLPLPPPQPPHTHLMATPNSQC